jgi:hypothetical protein
MHHPLTAIVLFISVVAGAVWLRFGTNGQHLSAEDFLLDLALVVIVGLTFAFVRIHLRKRSERLD